MKMPDVLIFRSHAGTFLVAWALSAAVWLPSAAVGHMDKILSVAGELAKWVGLLFVYDSVYRAADVASDRRCLPYHFKLKEPHGSERALLITRTCGTFTCEFSTHRAHPSNFHATESVFTLQRN